MDNLLFEPSGSIKAFQKVEENFESLSEILSFVQPWLLATYLSTTSAIRSADQSSRVSNEIGPFSISIHNDHNTDAFAVGCAVPRSGKFGNKIECYSAPKSFRDF